MLRGPWEGDSVLVVERDAGFLERWEDATWHLRLEPVGTTASEDDALELIRLRQPDIVLARIELVEHGKDGGRAFVTQALDLAENVRMIAVGSSTAVADVHPVLLAGAVAYVFADSDAHDLAWAVQQVYRRTVYVAGEPLESDHAVSSPELTPREQQVLALVSDGQGNKVIARALAISEETVKFHLSNIFRKLNVTNRTEASREAHRLRLSARVE
jgi:DNA-binding NarL/FixJ family response regulator